MRRNHGHVFLAFALVAMSGVASARELKSLSLEPGAFFAVVTRKAGVGKALAHDHIVYAPVQTITAIGSPDGDASGATFSMAMPVESLVVDDPAVAKERVGRLKELGILDEDLGEVSEKDRKTIHGDMIDKDQLDAKSHPEIRAELVGIRTGGQGPSSLAATHTATMRMTVKGKPVEKDIPASVTFAGGVYSIEAMGGFKFTEFGIKPVSILLGAIQNKDEFSVYTKFRMKVVAP